MRSEGPRSLFGEIYFNKVRLDLSTREAKDTWMPVANVIFSAFTVPYVSFLLFPVAATAAMVSEIAVFKLRYHQLSWRRSIGVTVAANLVSWFVGIVLGCFLPHGLVPKIQGSGDHPVSILTPGPHFNALMWAGFAVAFLLSIVIEFYVWKWYQKRSPLPKLLATTALAQGASYTLLIGIAWIYLETGAF